MKLEKPWMLSDAEYDRLNPREDIWVVRSDTLEVYYKFINDDGWCWVGYVPTPQTKVGWFLYHLIHGIWMRYPLWKVILFALDKNNYSRLSMSAATEPIDLPCSRCAHNKKCHFDPLSECGGFYFAAQPPASGEGR